jgi:hypothetical protein
VKLAGTVLSIALVVLGYIVHETEKAADRSATAAEQSNATSAAMAKDLRDFYRDQNQIAVNSVRPTVERAGYAPAAYAPAAPTMFAPAPMAPAPVAPPVAPPVPKVEAPR